MSRLTRDGTAEFVSRDKILRRERGQGNIDFPCLADHEQDWQPYPVDTYSCYMCDHTIEQLLSSLVSPHSFVIMLYWDMLSRCPFHNSSGCGNREAHVSF